MIMSFLYVFLSYRRYGVVEGRFCFEGGSSCGKGEGLYVFVTDQSDEITHTLKMASQGRLASKRRPIARKMSAMDSPRKQITSQISDVIHENHCIGPNDMHPCSCNHNTSSYWPSQESRDLDSNYGCGDTVSVSEGNDSFNDSDMYPRGSTNIERCMSCISKLGGPSMSRSSTTTGTPGPGPNPCWPSMEGHHLLQSCHSSSHQPPVSDSMSLGSHGSSGSEYSVPRTVCRATPQQHDSWYEKAPTFQVCDPSRATSPCQCCPPPGRPPKPNQKPPMPLPNTKSSFSGPYENYDVPKTPLMVEGENYDTPRKIKELLTQESCTSPDRSYDNYDMPASIGKMCGCGGPSKQDNVRDVPRVDCTCHRVMSWADNWIPIPICRRGNSVENTGVPINRIRVNGEGKMPVMQPSGELAIYATVDMAKKISRRLNDEEISSSQRCKCDHNTSTSVNTNSTNNSETENDENRSANYCNIDPTQTTILHESQMNYVNLTFEKSLENYENAKEATMKATIICNRDDEKNDNDNYDDEDEEEVDDYGCITPTQEIVKFCHKCGHHSNNATDMSCENLSVIVASDKQEDYMMMEPGKILPNHPGYIPMSPAFPNNNAPPLPSKTEILKRILDEKSASNPSLCGPAVDRSRKRCKNERITGTAMMMLCRNAGSPYNRKQLMDSTDLLPVDKKITSLKRSSSVESSNLVEPVEETTHECDDKSRKSSLSQIEGRRSSSPCLHQETELCEDESCCTKISVLSSETEDSVTKSLQQNYIRRSASVPCKGQNRDSSSSNDSGVSTGSLRQRGGDFNELELPLSTSMSVKKYHRHVLPTQTCVHSSLPRRSKSFDPLREISFQFQKIKIPEKSTSAEAEIPVCMPKSKGYGSPCDGNTANGPPYIDSRSTSSGTSDMSDYIETLSLSSHSSSDAHDGIK